MPVVRVPPLQFHPVVPFSKLPLTSRLPALVVQLQSGKKPKSYVLFVLPPPLGSVPPISVMAKPLVSLPTATWPLSSRSISLSGSPPFILLLIYPFGVTTPTI